MYSVPFRPTQEAYLQTSFSAIANPAANVFTPIGWTVQADPAGIVANASTVDPVADPTIIFTNPLYNSGFIILRIQELDRLALAGAQSLYVGLFNKGVSIDQWITVHTITIQAAAIVSAVQARAYTVIIPLFGVPPFAADAPMNASIGIGFPFGNATVLPINVIANVYGNVSQT